MALQIVLIEFFAYTLVSYFFTAHNNIDIDSNCVVKRLCFFCTRHPKSQISVSLYVKYALNIKGF